MNARESVPAKEKKVSGRQLITNVVRELGSLARATGENRQVLSEMPGSGGNRLIGKKNPESTPQNRLQTTDVRQGRRLPRS